MKIKALRNTFASGQPLEAGKIYEVSDKDAEILITMKKAEPAVEETIETKEDEKVKIAKKVGKSKDD